MQRMPFQKSQYERSGFFITVCNGLQWQQCVIRKIDCKRRRRSWNIWNCCNHSRFEWIRIKQGICDWSDTHGRNNLLPEYGSRRRKNDSCHSERYLWKCIYNSDKCYRHRAQKKCRRFWLGWGSDLFCSDRPFLWRRCKQQWCIRSWRL